MRTITTKLYTINELSEDAKKKAIEDIKEEYYYTMSNMYWEDAFETLKKVFGITGIKADITSNSQWFYCKSYNYDDSVYSEGDWDKLLLKIRQMPIDIWCDYEVIRTFVGHEYNQNITFEANIISAYIDFCRNIDYSCIDLLNDDENILEYAEENEIEFLENGKRYK